MSEVGVRDASDRMARDGYYRKSYLSGNLKKEASYTCSRPRGRQTQGKYKIDMYKQQQRRPIWRSKGIRTGWEMRVECGFFSLCDAKSLEGFEKSEVILIHVLKELLWFPLLGMTLPFVCLVNSYMF